MRLPQSLLTVVLLCSFASAAIKTYNYTIVSTNDFGDTVSTDKLPVLTVQGDKAQWAIQLYGFDVRFKTPYSQPHFDSILVRNEATKEVFRIKKPMLTTVSFRHSFAKVSGYNKLPNFIYDEATSQRFIAFLKKAKKVKVVYYRRSGNNAMKPILVQYNVQTFYTAVDKHMEASVTAPKYIAQWSTQSADPFGKGGSASGISAVLSGGQGLKRGGGGGNGRSSSAGIGFGAGTGSGFGGGSGGVNLQGLSEAGTTATRTTVKKRQTTKRPTNTNSAGMKGGRSRANIMRTVRNNMMSLKYAYQRRLKAKPGIKGKITVKWAIDEFGNVLHCRVITSTMQDPVFEKVMTNKIKRWAFGKIPIPGDVTEVTYPFVFQK